MWLGLGEGIEDSDLLRTQILQNEDGEVEAVTCPYPIWPHFHKYFNGKGGKIKKKCSTNIETGKQAHMGNEQLSAPATLRLLALPYPHTSYPFMEGSWS